MKTTSVVKRLLIALILVFSLSLTIAPNVQAQEEPIGITNLQYPDQAVLQNGVAQVTVTFTVSYAYLPSSNFLIFGIVYSGTSTYVGSGASGPDQCLSAYVQNTAACVAAPSSSSGTESASFSLTFNATQQYSLKAIAAIAVKSPQFEPITVQGAVQGFAISVITTTRAFTISVTAQTSPTTTAALTSTTAASTSASTAPSASTSESTPMIILALAYVIIALPFIGIIGLIIFLVRRRRRKAKRTDETTGEGLASKPSAPAPTTEETKFCTTCGARIPVTTPFCASCGNKQD